VGFLRAQIAEFVKEDRATVADSNLTRTPLSAPVNATFYVVQILRPLRERRMACTVHTDECAFAARDATSCGWLARWSAPCLSPVFDQNNTVESVAETLSTRGSTRRRRR